MKIQNYLLLLFLCSSISAQNFNDALRLSYSEYFGSARTLGMGNAFSGVADDYQAVFFNPAGLALVNKTEITGNLNYGKFSQDIEFLGNSSVGEKSNTGLTSFGFVSPIPTRQGSFAFSLGYQKIKDFTNEFSFSGFNSISPSYVNWNTNFEKSEEEVDNDLVYVLGLSYKVADEEGNFIGDETIINSNLLQYGSFTEEGSLNSWNAGVSFEAAKDLFVGVSFQLITGDYSGNRVYTEEDINDAYPIDELLDPTYSITEGFSLFELRDVIQWDVTGWTGELGFLYRYKKLGRLGASVKFPTVYTVQETYTLSGYSRFDNNQFIDETSFNFSEIEYDIVTPFELKAGGSFAFMNFLFSGSFSFIDYSQMEFSSGLDAEKRLSNNSEINQLFKAIINYNLGAEIIIPETGIRIRGGFMYYPSPYKGDPTEFDRKTLSLGGGVLLAGKFSLDAAYTFSWWENFYDNYGNGLSRVSQTFSNNRIMIGFSYRY